jgi:hypothetical protein
MGKFIELVGKRFGRLVVIKRNPGPKIGSKWMCLCDCGKTKVIIGSNLRAGYTQSCGCLHREKSVEANIKHGGQYMPEYKVWCGIRNRCFNPRAPRYPYYGGRGIKVSEKWSSFNQFITDMGPRPHGRYSIERVDGNKDYEPGNCIWATQKTQMRNTKRTIRVTVNGQEKPLITWCEEFGQGYELAKERIKRLKWEPLRALTTPTYHKKKGQNEKTGKNPNHTSHKRGGEEKE